MAEDTEERTAHARNNASGGGDVLLGVGQIVERPDEG